MKKLGGGAGTRHALTTGCVHVWYQSTCKEGERVYILLWLTGILNVVVEQLRSIIPINKGSGK